MTTALKNLVTPLLSWPVALAKGALPRVWLSWRGVNLPAAPVLETGVPGEDVQVLRCWQEAGTPFLKLARSGHAGAVDYAVCAILRVTDACYGLLELAPGWPGTPPRVPYVLVAVVDGGALRSLSDEQVDEVLAQAGDDVHLSGPALLAEVEALFGPAPDALSTAFRAQEAARRYEEERTREILCIHCNKRVSHDDAVCPHCGVPRTAPPCPCCGQPVCAAKDRRVYYADEHGDYPWHAAWDNRCAVCGLEFSARLQLKTGHRGYLADFDHGAAAADQPPAGTSELVIRGVESVAMWCDDWDYQPAVEVRVRRGAAANRGDAEAGLAREERIMLTPAEWRAVIDQLGGPLSVLLERKPWSRDTT